MDRLSLWERARIFSGRVLHLGERGRVLLFHAQAGYSTCSLGRNCGLVAGHYVRNAHAIVAVCVGIHSDRRLAIRGTNAITRIIRTPKNAADGRRRRLACRGWF